MIVNELKRMVRNTFGHPFFSTSLLKNSLCIFCYHEVSDHPSAFCKEYDLNVFPENFEKQLEFIGQYFNFISPLQLLEGQYPTPAALITFDDGMQGYFHNAIPILEKRKVPSIMFLNMAPIKGEVFWIGLTTYLIKHDSKFRASIQKMANKKNGKIPLFLYCNKKIVNDFLASQLNSQLLADIREYYGRLATLDDLESVANNPLVFFGNHLHNHYNVLTLSEEELKEEYLLNEEKILGYPNGLPLFSYPFGQPKTCFNEHSTERIFSFGAKAIFYSSGSINQAGQGVLYDRVSLGNEAQTIKELFSKLRYRKLRNCMNV